MARASPRPPEQIGLRAATAKWRLRQWRTSSVVSIVLPTPVSVPVMKTICFCMIQPCPGRAIVNNVNPVRHFTSPLTNPFLILTHLINGEGSAAFTPLQLSLAEYRLEITGLASVEA